ncbi:DUF5672 family protein [Anaerovibrio lipolyticus]|uniref:DUF5672 family protein n=1 Tax=Anaerovibrio lipolyticus TaxID=82374 RepID=UPI000489401C|nr:DUF5672 family protein [Anaerovibrio lipolyticus]
MNKVVIVIPIYSEKISDVELIALKQLDKVLYAYPKVFIAPRGLEFSYGSFCEMWDVVELDKDYFTGTVSYSSLLLSVDFYRKFSDYEYMLIYQLDGFVFSDRLFEFCELGFDYIGSAWPMNHRYTIGRRRAKIGNGGVSLRKISSTIKLLEQKEKIIKTYHLENMFLKVEDYFFSFCGSKENLNFKVPAIPVARKFCLDFPTDLPMALKCFKKRDIPFALHGWNKSGCIDYCLEQINKCGYVVPKEGMLYDYLKMIKTYLSAYIIDRCVRYNYKILGDILKRIIRRPVIIWGGGTFGIKCKDMLEYTGITIECCFDRKPQRCDIKGISIKQPDDSIIASHNYCIVITPFAYEDVIADDLEAKGLVEYDDFIKYSSIADTLIQEYFGIYTWMKG